MTPHAYSRRQRWAQSVIAGMLGLGPPSPTWAHGDSDASLHLTIETSGIRGRWEVAVRDLDFHVGLDADDDGRLSRDEWEARQPHATRYFLDRIRLVAENQPLDLVPTGWTTSSGSEGSLAQLHFQVRSDRILGSITLRSDAFFDDDPWHRLTTRWTASPMGDATAILSPDRRECPIGFAPQIPSTPDPPVAALSVGYALSWVAGGVAALALLLAAISDRSPRSRQSA